MIKILIVARHSKYEWRRKKLALTHIDMVERYSGREREFKTLLESHKNLLEVRTFVKQAFKDSEFIMMDQLEDMTLDSTKWDMVIALGGDDSFKYISHFVGSIPILGVNPDPDMSKGYLTSWKIKREDDAQILLEQIILKKYDVVQWNRPEITLDGVALPPATSEFFLGSKDRTKISRHIIKYRNREYKQKCSGLLVASEVGYTGWYSSALDSEANLDSYEVEDKDRLFFLATELFDPEKPHSSEYGDILRKEELVVHSLNDEGGKIVIDSWKEYDFDYGSRAVIKFGNPLIVVEVDE